MFCIDPNLKPDWDAWSAIGSLASAIGTFAAAAIALTIWLTDRRTKKKDREADAQVLSMLMLSELSALMSTTHALSSAVPTDQAERGFKCAQFALRPRELASLMSRGLALRTPRLERLTERAGALPATASKAIASLMTSVLGIEKMFESASSADSMDLLEVELILDLLLQLHKDAEHTYLALVAATGASKASLKSIKHQLDNVPS
ncbi:hypothetical protein [Xanthomonas arboricola]|uniref:hypothetical protein n=1 Tax=Xanthomonas arboricola TaxID=56448 RepID=UPI0011AFD33F|nr:hypothetical protein [Xanthomonas arboricola]MBB6573512.1 hydrogenase-4 membrane subunit HyfE [Xanthomonas arboricola]